MRQSIPANRKRQTAANRSGNPWRTLEIAHLYFIAHLAKSMRKVRKESGSEANVDSSPLDCPETERSARIILGKRKKKW
jgi:hypothetical protein